MSTQYIFLDRDGTLIEEPADFQIDSVEKFKLLPDVIVSLIALRNAGYRFVMVSNQDGLGTEKYPTRSFDLVQTLLLDILKSQGIEFEEIRICPHTAEMGCTCRKPLTGLVKDFLSSSDWNRKTSYVVGDRSTDLILAENLGVTGILVNAQYGWKDLTSEILERPRRGRVHRKTRETDIDVQVDLDSDRASQIQTGIGFFDHMLNQLSFHGGFNLILQAKGDLEIDDHHSIEDIGIALGSAMAQALGSKTGIGRFGFYLPMDDAAAQVALDLSGRSFFKFDGRWNREEVGGMSTEMITHFFRSLSDGLKANLHITVQGENTHHMAESAFKAVGRSLRAAIRQGDEGLPSTKGEL